MTFAPTALARLRWATATESTLASARTRAPAARVPQSVRTRRRPRRGSPGSTRLRPCRKRCRGSWGRACRSTVTAAGAAKAVRPAPRKLLYQKVSPAQHARWHVDTNSAKTRLLAFFCVRIPTFWCSYILLIMGMFSEMRPTKVFVKRTPKCVF